MKDSILHKQSMTTSLFGHKLSENNKLLRFIVKTLIKKKKLKKTGELCSSIDSEACVLL